MVAGQDPQLLALLVVVQADGARVVGRVHRLVELGHRQRVEGALGQPVPREAPVVRPAPVQLPVITHTHRQTSHSQPHIGTIEHTE